MNSVNLVGRLTRDVELRYTQKDNRAVVKNCIAVNSGLKDEEGKYKSYFFDVIFWNNQAEYVSKYLKKGNLISVSGKLVSGSYEKEDGTKVYTTDIWCQEVNNLTPKPKDERPEPEYPGTTSQPKVEDNGESDPYADFGEEVVINPDDLPF